MPTGGPTDRLSRPHGPSDITILMAKPDPLRTQIASRFARFDVAKIGGGYTLRNRRDGSPVARLKPFSDGDDFELLYWSRARERWRTFGPLGPMRLTLDEIQEIIENEPLFRRHKSLWSSLLNGIFR